MWPFIKESYLNRNKFHRNKTVGILVIVNILIMVSFFFATDVVMKLYQSGEDCKKSVNLLQEQLQVAIRERDESNKRLVDGLNRISTLIENNKIKEITEDMAKHPEKYQK